MKEEYSMKKFLSLVLALVMTMSLVTISAGATEYKDFTDKDEIQYAEAVTVLNKLGIITGYSEGDFRPEGELTRGAAAKILVSLLIGPDAAAALGNETSPYPDVPAGNNFAGVISFCKTSKIISGYGDGTFRPQGTLTGYAFAKMLLGALGYSSDYEGFTGPGWNMKVAKLGGEAGLFDRISFNGNATVTREQACQLALNTIKGTMVEYSGGMNITAGNASIVANPDRNYKSSNQEFATHISNRKASNNPDNAGGNLYTIEFGEEHFVDLRMDYDRNTNDVFGRPSNEWSWKKVTIGTFPIEPDYVFTEQKSHLDATDAAKNRATGLGGLKLDDGAKTGTEYTDFWLNGKLFELTGGNWGSNDFDFSGEAEIADISDLTDNGVTVEVYVSDQVANWITDVVVIKTQLMEVRRVGSDYVSLQAYDNGKPDNPDSDNNLINGFNQKAINVPVTNVQSEDDAYAVLSGMKAGDIVAVVPVSTDTAGTDYEVSEAYAPEQVKGALTGAEQYSTSTGSEKKTVAVTVGGTKYNVAQWSKDLVGIDADSVKVTKKDVTLYLDAKGNAMLAKDVGSTEDFIIIGSFTQTMKDGRIVTLANGWDINGEALELNLGSAKNVDSGWNPGDLAYYTNETKNHADWKLARQGGTWTTTGTKQIEPCYAVGEVTQNGTYEIKSSNVEVSVSAWGTDDSPVVNGPFVTTDKSVKFIYVNYGNDGEVDSVEVKTGVQNVKATEIAKTSVPGGYGAQVAVKKDAVKAVVIKTESTDAMSSNLMYIRERNGGVEKDENGNMIYKYTVVMMKPNENVDDEVVIYSDDEVAQDTFVAYTAKENANYSNFYDLRDHSSMTNRTTATYEAQLAKVDGTNNSLLYLGNYGPVKGDDALDDTPQVKINDNSGAINTNGGVKNVVRIRNAEIVDLRFVGKTIPTGEREIRSIDDLKWYFNDKDNAKKLLKDAATGFLGDGSNNETFEMQLVVNDNPSSDYFRDVSLIIITDRVSADAGLSQATCTGGSSSGEDENTATDLELTIGETTIKGEGWTKAGDNFTAEVKYNTASGAPTTATVEGIASEGATFVEPVNSGSATATLVARKNEVFGSVTLGDSDTVVVKVKSEDGSKTTTYTVTLKGVDMSAFNYTKMPAGAIAVVSALENQDLKTISDLIVYDDGTDATIEAQVKEALEFLSYTVTKVSTDPSGNVVWGATYDSIPVTGVYTPDIDCIEVTIGGAAPSKEYVDVTSEATISSLSGISVGNVKEVLVGGGAPVYHYGQKNALNDGSSGTSKDILAAGSTYTDAAFVKYVAAPTATNFTLKSTVDGEEVTPAAALYIDVDEVVVIEAKFTGATAVTNGSVDEVTAKTCVFGVGSGNVATVTADASNKTNVDAEETAKPANAGKIVYKITKDLELFKKDDTFTGTYTIVAPANSATLDFTPVFTPAT
ncbi:MAG: S-layer homology domain-containing protein [Oscillibacter sp.]|nr:S-layer homology domain-containing protein [Oscillibacter sp.]